mgnify:CR=1 FL=1
MRHPALHGNFEPLSEEAARAYRGVVLAALEEDAAANDATTHATIGPEVQAEARLMFRARGVLAGLRIAALAMRLSDARVRTEPAAADGSLVEAAMPVARIWGAARSMLAAERVALNFLGRLSGVATTTRAYVDAVAGCPVRICDTRKTTPGLRALERYAVRAGGGYNHRFDLSAAVLIKDNHIAALGSIAEAVRRARSGVRDGPIVEVECESIDDVREALEAGADAILLDNMELSTMRAAVLIAKGKAVIEASGGVTLETVRAIAQTGVEIISVGALTHGSAWTDVGLDFVPQRDG